MRFADCAVDCCYVKLPLRMNGENISDMDYWAAYLNHTRSHIQHFRVELITIKTS